ncbi:RagB/SusD family nutrient uptake outer membrane protein [Bacteroides sp. OttesenSCG-928-F21]|nr:RagB/SusD family nutrient uptake outer membrane protein [Bacteroides sp. OttesenSCG-928-F21]
MKHFTKWFIAAFIGTCLITVSCVDEIKFGDKFLEKAPGVDVTQDTIFGNAEYARRFLWNTYSKLYYGLPTYWAKIEGKMNTGMFETLSDCWHSHNSWDGVNRKYYSGSYKASDEDTGDDTRFGFTKENCWEGIRAAWLFIENIDRVPGMDDDEKARLKAEAKAIVASRYFDLFRHYGGLPLVGYSYDVATEYELPRATVEATVDYMVNLLNEAAATATLPWDLQGDGIESWQGRFTKAGVMGLKCKILLFAASPLFNDNQPYCTEEPQEAVTNLQVWYGAYKQELWQQCLRACEDFFDGLRENGYYELMQASGTTVDSYRAAYNEGYFSRANNTELLITTRNWGKWTNAWNQLWGEWCGFGGYTPTLEYMEMFSMADGTPFSWDDPETAANPFFTENNYNKPIRDPRLYETIMVNGAKYSGRAIELWMGGRENINSTEKETGDVATGFKNYKFYKEGKSSLNNTYMQWPYLRLAEMYLIYAEALLHNSRLTDAIKQVDIVRARVGLGGLNECNPGKSLTTNSANLLEEILRERACELGLEDTRLFDMIRYKRTDLFTKELHGLRIARADGGTGSWSDKKENERGPFPTQFTYEKFKLVNVSRSWWTSFSTKWFLSAFPPSEINKNYGLTQNPGW